MGPFSVKTWQLRLTLGAFGFVCPLLCASRAFAAEPGNDEACPTRDAIAAATATLLGKPQAPSEVPDLIDVVDLGDHYVVRVKGRAHDYTDESRDCAKRARVAAVFVALTLAPPDIGTTEEPSAAAEPLTPQTPDLLTLTAKPPPTSTPKAQKPIAVLPEPTRTWNAGAELGVRLAVAPQSGSVPWNVGGSFRLVYMSRSWGLLMGGDVPTSYTQQVDNVQVRAARYSALAGLRLANRATGNRLGVDIGVTAAMLRMQQLANARAQSAIRIEPALYLAGQWALATEGWISPTLGAFAEWVPAPTAIAVEPRGTVGHSAVIWTGVLLGVSIGRY